MIMASRLGDEGGEAIGGTLLVARHYVPVDGQRDVTLAYPSRSLTVLIGSRSRSGRVACT